MSGIDHRKLSKTQKEKITLLLLDFKSGKIDKKDTIERISKILCDRKRIGVNRMDELEEIIQKTDTVPWIEIDDLIKLIIREHDHYIRNNR